MTDSQKIDRRKNGQRERERERERELYKYVLSQNRRLERERKVGKSNEKTAMMQTADFFLYSK